MAVSITPLWDFVLILIDSSITSCTPISDNANSGLVVAVGPSVERIKPQTRVFYGPTHQNKTFIRDGSDIYVLIEEAGIYAVMNEQVPIEPDQTRAII